MGELRRLFAAVGFGAGGVAFVLLGNLPVFQDGAFGVVSGTGGDE